MKIGAFTTFLPEYSFPDACKLLKALGYEGVQPRIVPPASVNFDPAKPFNPWGNNRGGISESDFFADPKAVLKPATDLGLAITSVASYTSADDMERAIKMVKACGKAGIRHVRVGALGMPQENKFDYNAFLDRSRGAYKELVAEAKKAGVRPCLELHMGNVYPGASGAVALLRGFDPADVGILYDPANTMADGWEVPKVSLNAMGAYLAEVHVKNVKWVIDSDDPRGTKKWKTVNAPLGEGCVNWADIIEQLKAHGFNGWLVEEGHTEHEKTYDRLRDALALLKKLVNG